MKIIYPEDIYIYKKKNFNYNTDENHLHQSFMRANIYKIPYLKANYYNLYPQLPSTKLNI